MSRSCSSLAINNLDDFLYGHCPYPLTLPNGLRIGGGEVFPELNFTLPVMPVNAATMSDVRREYSQMIRESVQRAIELHAPGLVVEFELLPDLTLQPEWGAEVTALLREPLDKAQAEHGLKAGLRVTPNDIRDFARPPILRSTITGTGAAASYSEAGISHRMNGSCQSCSLRRASKTDKEENYAYRSANRLMATAAL